MINDLTKQKILSYFFKIAISFLAILFTSWLLSGGIHIKEPKIFNAVWIALVLSILNTFLKPLVVALTISISMFTFGFFLLVINACIVLLAGWFIPNSFAVDGFWWAFFFAIIVSVISSLLDAIGRIQMIHHKMRQMQKESPKEESGFTDYEEVDDSEE